MLAVIGWWESALALGVLALALGEFIALLVARREGLTRNVSRLVTHGLLTVLCAAYAWAAIAWSQSLGGSTQPMSNWSLLLLAGILGLALYEMVAHVWAMHAGATASVARLVTHMAMPMIAGLVLMMNLTRWQIYRTDVVADTVAAAAGSGMLERIGRWEVVLVAGVALLAVREIFGFVVARRAGNTANTWRLWIYGALTVLAAVYAWIEVSWARGLESTVSYGFGSAHPAMAAWGLGILAAMLFLSLYAFAVVAWARRFGLTESVERLATHLVIASFVVLVLVINLSRWQMYFDLVDQRYEQGIQTGAGQK